MTYFVMMCAVQCDAKVILSSEHASVEGLRPGQCVCLCVLRTLVEENPAHVDMAVMCSSVHWGGSW